MGRAITISVVSALIGAIAGAGVAWWFAAGFFGYGQTSGAIASVAVQGAVLEKLHSGDISGAQQMINLALDGDLMHVAFAVDDGFVLKQGGVDAIAKVRGIREASGYLPRDPDVRDAVARAYTLQVTKK